MTRVNLIFNTRNAFGLKHDGMLMNGCIAAFFKDVEIRILHHTMSRPERADVNIFLETLNPMHMTYAKKNIFIPNQEWYFPLAWDALLPRLTVWCKTHEGEAFFKAKGASTVFLGWSSLDAGFEDTLDFNKALFLAGNSRNKAAWIAPLVAAWPDECTPELTILCREHHAKDLPSKPNVKIITEFQEESAVRALQQSAGIHMCLSDAEGFGHFQNEARSVGALMVINDIAPCNESELFDVAYGRAVKTAEQAVAACQELAGLPARMKREAREAAHDAYCANHKAFLSTFQHVFFELLESLKDIPEPPALDASALPSVSILTPTKNRRNWMKLASYCFLATNYPREKLEWVILDDGSEPCKSEVEQLEGVRYVMLEEDPERTIGQKRNELVKLASHDILVHMDDDDYYPPNSVLERVSALLSLNVDCVFSSTLPMYDPERFTSAMNVPPIHLPGEQRVSEATLCYRRDFWQERGFEGHIGEGTGFLSGRIGRCRDIDPTNVIVTMLHAKNTSSRRMPEGTKDHNGCHFGLSDDLFVLVGQLGYVTSMEKKMGVDYLPLSME